jgi:hypothetical protein
MGRNFSHLSAEHFEALANHLVGRHLKVTFETFTAGPDEGIDGRVGYKSGDIILQSKHYEGSGFASLKAAMRNERAKINKLAPRRYILVTSVGLTPRNKNELADIIGPSLNQTSDIFGREDVAALLAMYPDVEDAHPELWAQSATVMKRIFTDLMGSRARKWSAVLSNIWAAPCLTAVIVFSIASGWLSIRWATLCTALSALGVAAFVRLWSYYIDILGYSLAPSDSNEFKKYRSLCIRLVEGNASRWYFSLAKGILNTADHFFEKKHVRS